jgi:8-oxo-dGTP diphosphatase
MTDRPGGIFGAPEDGVVYRVRPAAYAVVLDAGGRVACVTEGSGLFLPGGGLEPGEDAASAVHREVAEECARSLEIVAPLGAAVQFHRTPRGEAFELRATFFLARFGAALDRAPQHALTWLPAAPETPSFHHACHAWAVRRAMDLR